MIKSKAAPPQINAIGDWKIFIGILTAIYVMSQKNVKHNFLENIFMPPPPAVKLVKQVVRGSGCLKKKKVTTDTFLPHSVRISKWLNTKTMQRLANNIWWSSISFLQSLAIKTDFFQIKKTWKEN